MIEDFIGLGCTVCFNFKVHTHLSENLVSFFIHTFFSDFLTGGILITIYNILKYLTCIKIICNNNTLTGLNLGLHSKPRVDTFLNFPCPKQ